MVSAVLLQSFIWISLIATGVQYDITHIISSMCVVRQSTVLIPCKYTHSEHEQVSTAEWLHEKSPQEEEGRVSQDPAFEGRVELQADAGNCSLLLRDVNESDAGIFRFVLSTGSGRNWTNDQGIRLEVTDAEVEVKTQSDNVTEGDWILFICGSCIPSMTVPTYIWRKDGHLHSQRHGDNMLDLESVGLEDRGQYFCTISGHEGLNSTSVNITVRPGYPPQNISVSVSPSGEIVGDSVSLSCISDAKPSAEISWFKENETSAVGSGQSFSISSFSSSFSGRFYCEAQNKYGSQRSASVSLSVSLTGGWTAGLYAAAGIGAALICICIIVVVIKIISRKTGDTGVRGGVSKQENSSAAVTDQMSTCDSGVQNDLMYSSIDHKRPRKHQSAGDEDEVQYATVHHHRNTENTSVKAEGPSGDVRDLCPADSVRSDDSSVIYSSINVA